MSAVGTSLFFTYLALLGARNDPTALGPLIYASVKIS
jgi:hypothetical protein